MIRTKAGINFWQQQICIFVVLFHLIVPEKERNESLPQTNQFNALSPELFGIAAEKKKGASIVKIDAPWNLKRIKTTGYYEKFY